jgi:hypothetical protein
MKRLLLAFAIASLSTLAPAFDFKTLDKSVGLGFSMGPFSYTVKVAEGTEESKSVGKTTLMGGFAYFDAKYAQLSLGICRSSSIIAKKTTDDLGVMGGSVDEVFSDYPAKTYLSLGLLGKYPIQMTGFALFPILGFEYDLNVAYKDSEGNDLKEGLSGAEKSSLNQFWIKAGLGLDIPVTLKTYIRPEVLFGYKLHSKLERDQIDAYESDGAESASIAAIKVDFCLLLGYQL